jgi:hypothetical protein
MSKRSKYDKVIDARANAVLVGMGPDIDDSDEYPQFVPCPDCKIIEDPECSLCGGYGEIEQPDEEG